MKQVFDIRKEEKSATLAAVLGDQAIFKYGSFDGTPKLSVWDPIECCFYKPRKNMTDFASFSMLPVLLSNRVQSDIVLRALLVKSCELLPLSMPTMAPIMIHSTKVDDCVDEASSRIKYLSDDVWVFFKDMLPPSGQICRLGHYRTAVTIIVTDSDLPPEEDFYQWYHKQGYTGLRFKLLWQSDK